MASDQEQKYRWTFGAGEFDESSGILTHHGQPVRLEPKPLKLLALLLRHAGEVVTREEIQAEVWDSRITVANTIPTAIGKLRKVLTDDCTIRIETVPRSGYRLSGETERVAVGRVASNRLALSAGESVPTRTGWILAEQINSTAYSDIWLARDRARQNQRVFKFAVDGGRLSGLKREAALNDLLKDSLGDRYDIAPMVDTNFAEPPFFLAYDYEGLNLRAWAAKSSRFSEMSRQERLALFARICRAVAAAHSIGVLHKDIKPDNILIAEQANGRLDVKLGDFGNSELLEPEQLERLSLTVDGVAVTRDTDSSSGTLMYLAPELLQTGTATVRSDIFALGVLLFQLLTGSFKQPLTPGWRRRIDDELLADDIAAATDHDPARRPASVDELVRRIEDLDERRQKRERKRQRQEALERSQRALEQQRARRPWIWAMVGSLVVGLGLSLYLYREAEQGRQQAEAFVEKMQAVQQFLSEDIIARANPMDPLYDPEAGIGAILEDAAQQIDTRFGDAPRAAAGLHRSVGNAFKTLRRDEAADSHLGKARTLYTETLGAGHPTTALVGYEQVDALVNAHDIDRARELVQQVDADAMAELQPVVRYRRYFTYARLYAELHDIPTAVEFFEQAISAYRQAKLNKPVQLARLKMGLIDAYIRLAEAERAQALLDEVRTMSASEQLPADLRTFSTRSQARVYRELGDDRRALEIAEQAVREMTELYGEAHYQTIISMSLVAQLQARLDDCDGTLATSRRVFELMRELYGANYANTLIEQSNLGTKQFACDQPEEAIANLRVAANGLRQQFGDENRAVHQISFFLAKYLHQTGEHDEALGMLDRLEKVALDKIDGLPITAGEILLWRGRVLVELGRPDEARGTLERAARLAEAGSVSDEIAAEIDAELARLLTANATTGNIECHLVIPSDHHGQNHYFRQDRRKPPAEAGTGCTKDTTETVRTDPPCVDAIS